MTISYNWLCEYLPVEISPEELSVVLTSLGLEVESLEKFEPVKGGLKGLVIGEVVECSQHPNADKLRLTKVNTGAGDLLKILECERPARRRSVTGQLRPGDELEPLPRHALDCELDTSTGDLGALEVLRQRDRDIPGARIGHRGDMHAMDREPLASCAAADGRPQDVARDETVRRRYLGEGFAPEAGHA